VRRVRIWISSHHRLRSSCWLSCLIGLSILQHGGSAFCSSLVENQKVPSGPIPIVNQAPIQLLFLQAMPDRAEIVPKGHGSLRLNTIITNTLLSQQAGSYEGVIDMEMIRSSLDLWYGIAPGFEICMSLPFVYSYGGIMDHAILNVEQFFNSVRKVREEQKPDRYEYAVKKNEKAFISGKEKRCTGVGDLVLRIKGRIWDEGDRVPGIMLGGEYTVKPRLSLLMQVNYVTRPFKDTGLEMLDKRILDLLLGVNYYTKHGILIQGGAVEDFFDSEDAGADITFFLNIGMYF